MKGNLGNRGQQVEGGKTGSGKDYDSGCSPVQDLRAGSVENRSVGSSREQDSLPDRIIRNHCLRYAVGFCKIKARGLTK